MVAVTALASGPSAARAGTAGVRRRTRWSVVSVEPAPQRNPCHADRPPRRFDGRTTRTRGVCGRGPFVDDAGRNRLAVRPFRPLERRTIARRLSVDGPAPGQPDSPVTVESRYDNFIGGDWVAPGQGPVLREHLARSTGRAVHRGRPRHRRGHRARPRRRPRRRAGLGQDLRRPSARTS